MLNQLWQNIILQEATPDPKLEPTSSIMPEGLPSGIILEVGSSF